MVSGAESLEALQLLNFKKNHELNTTNSYDSLNTWFGGGVETFFWETSNRWFVSVRLVVSFSVDSRLKLSQLYKSLGISCCNWKELFFLKQVKRSGFSCYMHRLVGEHCHAVIYVQCYMACSCLRFGWFLFLVFDYFSWYFLL